MENSNKNPSASASSVDIDTWEEAFERVLPDLLALPAEEVKSVNVDILAATATAMAVLPNVRAYRDRIAKNESVDLALIDKLEDYAQAAACAQLRHGRNSASGAVDEIRGLQERVLKYRGNLLRDVETLVHREILPPESLTQLRRANGHKNALADLFMLADTLRENWAVVGGRCATTLAELDEVSVLVSRLHRLFATRDQALVDREQTAHLRDRAFTLFVRSYDEVRRAIHFLRWATRDGDVFAPSLFGNRAGRRRSDEVEDPDFVAPEDRSNPASPLVPVTPVTPGASASATPAAIALAPVVGPFDAGGPFLA